MHAYPAWVHPNGTILCTAPGCHINTDPEYDHVVVPRHAIVGSDLCTWHENQLARLLTDLATVLRDVRNAVLKPAPALAVDGGRSSTVSDVSTRWNPAASAIAYEIDDWAGFLVRTVVRERMLPDGQSHGLTVGTDASVALMALGRWHASWLARYPTLGPDILRSALEHRRATVRALNTTPVHRVTLQARCGYVIADTDLGPVLCEGRMVGILRAPSDRTPSAVVCSTNPHHPQLERARWMEAAYG